MCIHWASIIGKLIGWMWQEFECVYPRVDGRGWGDTNGVCILLYSLQDHTPLCCFICAKSPSGLPLLIFQVKTLGVREVKRVVQAEPGLKPSSVCLQSSRWPWMFPGLGHLRVLAGLGKCSGVSSARVGICINSLCGESSAGS